MRASILVITLVSATCWAGTYKCIGPDGKVSFQQTTCPTEEQQAHVDTIHARPPTPTPQEIYGGHPVERQIGWGQREAERRHNRIYEGHRAYEQRHSPVLGYGDEAQIRHLELRKRDLQDELRRIGGQGLGNYGKAQAISDQIRSLDEQVMQIRSRPTGH